MRHLLLLDLLVLLAQLGLLAPPEQRLALLVQPDLLVPLDLPERRGRPARQALLVRRVRLVRLDQLGQLGQLVQRVLLGLLVLLDLRVLQALPERLAELDLPVLLVRPEQPDLLVLLVLLGPRDLLALLGRHSHNRSIFLPHPAHIPSQAGLRL